MVRLIKPRPSHSDAEIDKRVRLPVGIRDEKLQQGEVTKETRAAEGVGGKFRLLCRVKARIRCKEGSEGG
jgi:hypothetical protein